MKRDIALNIIKELQEKFGLRLEEIAIKTGLSYSTIRGYRVGIRNPIAPTVEKLKQILRRYNSRG